MDCLNLDNDGKSTLVGSEFQTLTIHSVKKLCHLTHCAACITALSWIML